MAFALVQSVPGRSVPWGISESAYAGRDHSLAYQYAPQGVPRLALRRTPPLGRIRDFRLSKGGDHPHTFDLKLEGLTPLVDGARVLALRYGLVLILLILFFMPRGLFGGKSTDRVRT